MVKYLSVHAFDVSRFQLHLAAGYTIGISFCFRLQKWGFFGENKRKKNSDSSKHDRFYTVISGEIYAIISRFRPKSIPR